MEGSEGYYRTVYIGYDIDMMVYINTHRILYILLHRI